MRAYKAARDRKQPKHQIAAKKKNRIPCGKRLRNNVTLNIIASSGNIHPVCKLMRDLANASQSLYYLSGKKITLFYHILPIFYVPEPFLPVSHFIHIRDTRVNYVII